MAIILEAAYSKKLGLPNFSSHSYVVSVRTELSDIEQVQEESSKLYQTLQEAVDREIEQVGFLPDAMVYGMETGEPRSSSKKVLKNGSQTAPVGGSAARWACSEKQQDLVLRFIQENEVEKNAIEGLANDMFDKRVVELNRLEMSGVIEEMFSRYGRKNGRGRNGKYAQRERSRS